MKNEQKPASYHSAVKLLDHSNTVFLGQNESMNEQGNNA